MIYIFNILSFYTFKLYFKGMIMLPIKRTIKKRFFEFNIFVYNALS